MSATVGSMLGMAGGVMAIVMALLWWVQYRTRNAGWVDVGWAAGLSFTAIAYALLADGDPIRRAFVGVLGGAWGLRLAVFLFLRVSSEPEDGRYQNLRRHWGERANSYLFLFFEGQALLVVLFSIPWLVCAFAPSPLAPIWLVLAGVLWLGSVLGESIADKQLHAFRRDPANGGRTCRVGLWRYSRHPNYFFEWLHWWSYVVLAIGAPHGWLTLAGPILMLLFLYKVTGIPYTEQQALSSRGDDYRRYQETTSAFFPWFPKEPASPARPSPANGDSS